MEDFAISGGHLSYTSGMDSEEKVTKMLAARKELNAYNDSVAIELQVRNVRHARSEEVLQFCMRELSGGTTYNALRRKLGCGPAQIDRKWRVIRELLVEHILPDTDEEVMKASFSMSAYMVTQMEKFLRKVQARAEACKDKENEHFFLKAEIEALKILSEKYENRMTHYLKMRDVRTKEKASQGKSIVFQNNYYVPRPGQVIEATPLEDAAEVFSSLEDVDE